MGEDTLYLVTLNATTYLLTFLIYQKIKKRYDIGSLLLMLFCIANIFSVYYFSIDYVKAQYNKITLLPYVYLFLLTILSMFPILKFNIDRNITIKAIGSEKLINFISICVGIISLPVLLETLGHLLSSSISGSFFVKVYSREVDGHSFLSWLSRKFNFILSMMKVNIIVIFFYCIHRKKNIKVIIGLFLGILTNLLSAFLGASRGNMAINLLMIIFTFLLFIPLFEPHILRKLKKIGIIIIGGFLILILLITIFRYKYSSDNYTFRSSIWEWVALYFGEGSLRFNNEIWYTENYLFGKNSFTFFFDSGSNRELLLSKYLEKNGTLIEVFYTYVGDFIIDFGIIGGIVMCLMINILLSNLTKKRRVYPLEIILLIVTVSQLFLAGFTANIFRGDGFQYNAVWAICLSYLLYIMRKQVINHKI